MFGRSSARAEDRNEQKETKATKRRGRRRHIGEPFADGEKGPWRGLQRSGPGYGNQLMRHRRILYPAKPRAKSPKIVRLLGSGTAPSKPPPAGGVRRTMLSD